MGWSAIIYLAAISGIDPGLYEAAELDGAGRWSKMWNITIQCIRPTIALLFILAVSGCLTSNFDQIFFLSNSANMARSETIDLYIYIWALCPVGSLFRRPCCFSAVSLPMDFSACAISPL